MSTNTSGRFVWHELVTPDPKAAVGFYGELLNWKSSEVDMGPLGKYTLFKVGDVDVAGAIAPPPSAKVPPSWLAYCCVTDVDAAVAKASSLGGKAMAQPMDIPNVGRFAVVLDKEGAALAPFKPTGDREESDGPPPVGHFCWDELLTSDPKSALAFYEAIYGWKHEDKDMGPMGTYHVLKRGEHMAGGIMKAPMAEQPPSWLSYVAVADVDASAKRAAQLKGTIVVPPRDIPHIGRFAVVTDPQGAALSLFKGAPGSNM